MYVDFKEVPALFKFDLIYVSARPITFMYNSYSESNVIFMFLNHFPF